MLPVILVHLWCIQNKLVLKKNTDIIHVAMGGGGGQKSFDTCWGGSKNFQLPSPPTKVFMNTPLITKREIENFTQVDL